MKYYIEIEINHMIWYKMTEKFVDKMIAKINFYVKKFINVVLEKKYLIAELKKY